MKTYGIVQLLGAITMMVVEEQVERVAAC